MPSQSALKLEDRAFPTAFYLKTGTTLLPAYTTPHGSLFADDCMAVLPHIRDGVIDTVFADPPFNLGKEYGQNCNDQLPDLNYLDWCMKWTTECVRVLKPGGSFFLYNLPKWNITPHDTSIVSLFIERCEDEIFPVSHSTTIGLSGPASTASKSPSD